MRYIASMTTPQVVATSPSPSRRIAAEIRAEAARQGLSLRRMSLALGKSQPWMTRRVSITADVDMTLEELDLIAAVLGVTAGELLTRAAVMSDRTQPVTNRYPITGGDLDAAA